MDMIFKAARIEISIHAPREGRDELHETDVDVTVKFQSTRPARGATKAIGLSPPGKNISIHAPREGRDLERRSYLVI